MKSSTTRNIIAVAMLASCIPLIVQSCGTSRSSKLAPTLAIGMTRAEFKSVVNQIGAEDITSGQAVASPAGEGPLKGIYFEAKDIDIVLAVGFTQEKLSSIECWNKADFNHSKLRRAKTGKPARSIVFDMDRKTCRIE